MQKQLINAVILALLFFPISYAKTGRQAILQSGNSAIIEAKGDIPNPPQYQQAIDNYMQTATNQLQKMTDTLYQLNNSLAQHDIPKAQMQYLEAHYLYETVRPLILIFGNTDRLINSTAKNYTLKEEDPNFQGFHALEYSLFVTHDINSAEKYNRQLLKYTKDLVKRVSIETIFLPKLVQSTPDFAEYILENKLTGQSNLYSGADLGEINANLDGIEFITKQLHDFLPQNYLETIYQEIQNIRSIIATYKKGNSYLPYSKLSTNDKHMLYGTASQLAEILSQMRGILAIDVYHQYERKVGE